MTTSIIIQCGAWDDGGAYLIADANVGKGPGVGVPHARPQPAPLRARAARDELDGVQRVLHHALDPGSGHALLVAETVVEDPDGLRAQLLTQQHVLVQAQPCMPYRQDWLLGNLHNQSLAGPVHAAGA